MKTLVVLAVVCFVAYAVWHKWRKLPSQTKQLWSALFGMAGAYRRMKKQQNNTASGSVQSTGHLMIGCERCGLHVLENEGVRVRGRFYCCAEHAQ